jgi:pyruvate/2-oxoglutarate dehydrogenase complex dihydrolipoamide dehydrogenase (E3) component
MLKTKTVSARALPEGIEVTFASAEEGGTAPATQVYDLLLQAVGRTPNGKKIHPHPTLGESIGMAAEIAHGSCTDVPPARK